MLTKVALHAENIPLYANGSVKFEEDVVSCSGSDGPEEVLPQVGLLQSVSLVHLGEKNTRLLVIKGGFLHFICSVIYKLHNGSRHSIFFFLCNEIMVPSLKWRPQLGG